MKKLLMVDDDAVLTRAYSNRLSRNGFQVNTAATAATAMSILRSARPDLMVLDLALPDVSGVQLLKNIRSEPTLAPMPVVVLTNNYGNAFGMQANLGIERAFLKAECNPTALMGAIDEILHPQLAIARPPEPVVAPPTPAQLPAEPAPAGVDDAETALLEDSPSICADLALFESLARELQPGPDQQDQLQDLFLKTHALTAAAGQTRFALLAQTTGILDALLNAVIEDPNRLNPSLLGTVVELVEVIRQVFQRSSEPEFRGPLRARVLVVDDDAPANQGLIAALAPAQFDACSTDDAIAAWQWISGERFDLIVLDMEMPVLDGLQLCRLVRDTPGSETTSVLLIADQDAPNAHFTGTKSGANDVIAKPILPQELAARAVLHLVKKRLQL